MAKFHTEDGEEERPLIFNDPELTAEMARLRDRIVSDQGDDGLELVGLAEGPGGEWRGVFKRKAMPPP